MTKRTIEIIVFFAALLLAGLVLSAWLASRGEQQRLQSTLDAQKKLLDAADARESGRNATLAATLAQISSLKRATQTPEQIVRDLAKYLSLPQPITLGAPAAAHAVTNVSPSGSPVHGKNSRPSHTSEQGTGPSPAKGIAGTETSPPPEPEPNSSAPAATAQNSLPDAIPESTAACYAAAGCAAEIPPADLKPLYDYVQDCRACQAELAVAKQNAADDASKLAALTAERNAAITASKGGTFWRRLRRNAMWFAVGAAAGSAAGFVAATR
jgi:hypothetical protein